ncbi:MAG: alpha/beta fold hydrolase [Proteobacteria bacterium]|nr:alpha/beta fold hydrolase [Pseudomonadota bacterium]
MKFRVPAWAVVAGCMFSACALGATPPDACIANATASLTAFVHGDYAAVGKHFAPELVQGLPPAKLKQTWGQIEGLVGAYQSHGPARQQVVQGKPAVVVPVQFARGALDFVTACDADQRLSAFYLLEPSAVAAASPATSQVLPDGARVEPLDVPSPDGPLRGALTLPAGKGPFPAVVLVSGSGANDMDETVEGNKPFKDIAEGLAQAGVASLRYDKRTLDHALKAAANPDFTIDDEVTDDALSALHLLTQQQAIDPQRVFVLGHSLGAQMAPRIAQRDPQLAGVIMLAAPARPILDVIAAQQREQGERTHQGQAEIAGMVAKTEAEKVLLAKADPAHPPQGRFAGMPQAYWLSWQNVDQVAAAKSLTLPILILQGGNDFQISPALDFDAWKQALAGKPNVTFHLFPGLSHLFMPGPTRSPTDYAKPAHVDPAVIATIASWIKAQPAR